MTISRKDWLAFLDKMRKLSNKASEDIRVWVVKNRQRPGGISRDELIEYCIAVVDKYGGASSALAATWYDAVAELSGKLVNPAEVAAPLQYGEVAKTVNGVLKQSQNEEVLAGAVERLVKMQGVDTTLQNAIRDGAECAWIPHGDTCAFCIALASRGWQRASKNLIKNGHAEHIHGNCDCTYAVRFDGSTEVAGYDYREYQDLYYGADGRNSTAKINSMRREFYAENKDRINEQKRIAYQKRRELEKTAEEKNV